MAEYLRAYHFQVWPLLRVVLKIRPRLWLPELLTEETAQLLMRRVVLRKTQGYFQLLYDVVGDVIGILEGALVHAIGEVSFK